MNVQALPLKFQIIENMMEAEVAEMGPHKWPPKINGFFTGGEKTPLMGS